MTEETSPFLPEGEAQAFEAERNVPVAHLHRMGERLRDAWLKGFVHPMHLPAIDAQLVSFMDLLGGCERIHNTSLPFSYTILIHRIVGIYCLLLPFGVVETIHWATPIVVMFISYAFFGLDQIGEEIVDPFGVDVNDLALSAMTRNIEINLRQRLGDANLPEALRPDEDGVLS